MRGGACLVALLALLPLRVAALTFTFPEPAATTVQSTEPMGNYRMPVGPWKDGAIPTLNAEGVVEQRVWRIVGRSLGTLQILNALRDQVTAAGFAVAYECETDACGGFDFRYGTEVQPEPMMHVDLGDFRYLAARRRGPNGQEVLSLLVSRSADAAFVQMVAVGGAPSDAASATAPQTASASTTSATPATTADDFASRLESSGSVALDDLKFDSGAAVLDPGPYSSLTELAAYLKANPKSTVALVGHTDAVGSLDANVALSKKRATSVADALINDYGVNPSQLDAEGVGYLAPRATNLTEAGRTENRRVEVMLTSTQ